MSGGAPARSNELLVDGAPDTTQNLRVAYNPPVDAVAGKNPDGSAYLEIGNLEQIFRTRWTVRVTLHPGRAYLDEQIRIFNPEDAVSP